MSKILDLQKRANSLLSQHQSDTDEKLNNEISQIFKDMRNTVRSEAQSLKGSIDSEKQSIQDCQSVATAEILKQHSIQVAKIEQQQAETAFQIMLEKKEQIAQILKQQSEATAEILLEQSKLKASLSKYNDLSQETADQIKLKKALFTSNIVLISVACIALISSICLGYVSKSKYNDIKAMEAKVIYLKQNGGSLNIQRCGNEKKSRLCVQSDPTAPVYGNNFVAVQETN